MIMSNIYIVIACFVGLCRTMGELLVSMELNFWVAFMNGYSLSFRAPSIFPA